MSKFLLAVSGPTAAGKGTILRVLKDSPERYTFSVSYTTRPPREGEIHAHHYHFITKEEFEEAITNDEFVEYEKVHDNLYGTKRADLGQILADGRIPVLEIDVKGVKNLKERYEGRVVSIFIEPPSLEVLIERLEKRGTEDEATRNLRISRIKEEMTYRDQYDHILVNDTVERAQKELLEILDKEEARG